jgi:hypothetical protein
MDLELATLIAALRRRSSTEVNEAGVGRDLLLMGVWEANRLVTSATRRICMVTMKGVNGVPSGPLLVRGFNLRTDIWCYHLQAVKVENCERKLLTESQGSWSHTSEWQAKVAAGNVARRLPHCLSVLSFGGSR